MKGREGKGENVAAARVRNGVLCALCAWCGFAQHGKRNLIYWSIRLTIKSPVFFLCYVMNLRL